MAVTVASLQAVLDLDKRGFERGIKTSETMLNRLANVGVQRGINAIENGLRTMSDAVVDSVRKSADLEAQLSSVGAVSGATADEIADIKELVKELGIDPNLKVSSFEAADAIEMLARNGLDLQDVMDGAARSTVLLANSTGGDFSLAADIATDSMMLFNIEAKEMDKAVNGITSVVTNSKFSVDDYRLALAQAGGVAASVGVEFDDFNTVIAGIAPLFASGSDAGTSFKTMLQRLVPSSEKAAKTMTRLGIITEDGANQFFDAAGNLRPMVEISQVLDNALSDLSEEQRNQALATIFGTDAMRAAVGLMDLGAEGFGELQAAMAQTDAAEAAAQRMDNLAGTLEILDGVAETLKIELGDGLNPTVRTAAENITEFLDRSKEANAPTAELGMSIRDNLIGPVADLAESMGILNEDMSSVDTVMSSIDSTLNSLGPSLQATGTSIQLVSGIINGAFGIFDYFDGQLAGVGIEVDILSEAVKILQDVFWTILNPFSRVVDGFDKMYDAIVVIRDAWPSFVETLEQDIGLPDWLVPGSPTPFELGLRGIAGAIDDMPELGQAVSVPSGGGTTNNFNFGGFSASVSTQGDGGEQAIQMVVQMLRAELSRA